MKVFENGNYREATPYENAMVEELSCPEILIEELKQQLAKTDYKAIKYAEGALSEEEYSSVKAQRQQWRNEINRLQVQG